jgi:hypothetical protein
MSHHRRHDPPPRRRDLSARKSCTPAPTAPNHAPDAAIIARPRICFSASVSHCYSYCGGSAGRWTPARASSASPSSSGRPRHTSRQRAATDTSRAWCRRSLARRRCLVAEPCGPRPPSVQRTPWGGQGLLALSSCSFQQGSLGVAKVYTVQLFVRSSGGRCTRAHPGVSRHRCRSVADRSRMSQDGPEASSTLSMTYAGPPLRA